MAAGPDGLRGGEAAGEMTATSVVLPPVPATVFPAGLLAGGPAPIAAAVGSSMMQARRAPGLVAGFRARALPCAGDPARHRRLELPSVAGDRVFSLRKVFY